MPDFAPNMTKEQKAYLAVGQFMFHFAGMEFNLNLILRSLLNLGMLEASIITSNIDVRTKVYIVQTAVNMRPIKDDELLAKAKADLKSVVKMAEKRNILAHNHFSAEADGIDFYYVKAKGNLALPDEKWSYDTIDEYIREMARLTFAIQELSAKLVKHPATELLHAMSNTLGNLNPSLAQLIGIGIKAKAEQAAEGEGAAKPQ